jgi:hypothetical protein
MPVKSGVVMIYSLVIILAVIWPICRVAGKAGYSNAWGLLVLIPLVNVIALCFFAYAEWPVERR